MKKYQFIKNNMNLIKRLTNSGDLSPKLLSDYNIYMVYTGQTGSKMERYQGTAEAVGKSTLTVMNAIKSMIKKI